MEKKKERNKEKWTGDAPRDVMFNEYRKDENEFFSSVEAQDAIKFHFRMSTSHYISEAINLIFSASENPAASTSFVFAICTILYVLFINHSFCEIYLYTIFWNVIKQQSFVSNAEYWMASQISNFRKNNSS